eukprot:m.319396 g.319396  ORF g.319396 m.319396 type:complete len:112 (-) comp16445_c1_seq1:157-492(-)
MCGYFDGIWRSARAARGTLNSGWGLSEALIALRVLVEVPQNLQLSMMLPSGWTTRAEALATAVAGGARTSSSQLHDRRTGQPTSMYFFDLAATSTTKSVLPVVRVCVSRLP